LLRVFKALKEKHRDLKLVILGEGELKEYLVKLSQELGLKLMFGIEMSFQKALMFIF
jgi:Glycosyl transferases group 1.